MLFREARLWAAGSVCTACCCCCPQSPLSGGNYSFCLSLLHWASHRFSPPHSMMLISVSFSLTSLRLLEHQLQTQRRTYDNEVESLRSELQNVKEENNRQQQLLAQNLQLPPEARIEASLQHEITRLTNENLVCCSFHTQIRGGAKLCLTNSA